jgi:hypothetical protein
MARIPHQFKTLRMPVARPAWAEAYLRPLKVCRKMMIFVIPNTAPDAAGT